MHRNRMMIGLLFVSVCLARAQQPYLSQQQLSIKEAEQLLLKNNAQLQLKQSEVAVAQANVTQSRAFDNPQIGIAHNINNPVTHHYFDLGYEGETDVQLSQRIYIGGQRMNGVRKSIAELSGTEADLDNERRIVLHDLRRKMIDINALFEKGALDRKEITSLQKILSIYETQVRKGNLPATEVTRIKTLLFQATKDRQGNETDMLNAQKELQILLGLDNVEIVPVINEREMLDQATLLKDTTYMFNRIYSRGDIRQSESNIEAAQHEIKLQKSNALPEISLTGEWDKNGNIGHNFFDIGVSLSVPLFNRNKGNIRAARETHNQAIINKDIAIRDAKAEVRQAYATIHSLQQLDLSDNNMNELDQMMDHATTQYMHRNISLLAFVDYYSSYKDTKTSIIDSRCQLLQAVNDLRTAANQ